MNVYSIRLIPSLKLKLCQFLGIASTLAIDELSGRLGRLELKIDRLDSQLRRGARRPLVVPAVELESTEAPVKKKSTRPLRATTSKPPKAKPRLVELAPVARVDPAGGEDRGVELEAPLDVLSPARLEAGRGEAVAASREAVLVIAPEEGTRAAVNEYFGADVDILEREGIEGLEGMFAGRKVTAVIFERALLGQEVAHDLLARLGRLYPETRWIGLSSYLTLAFAQSMPEREDFATFLTRPLSADALAGVLAGTGSEPSAATGRTDPA